MEKGRAPYKVVKSDNILKIGILGGSFDPVHCGHIGLAEDALVQAQLDKVVFVPAAHQPFKLDRDVTSGHHRFEMLKLAIKEHEHLEISQYELESRGISYTYLTMRAMQKQYGEEVRLYFITGTDSFLKIEKWMNSEELLKNYSFIIGTRPGYKKVELDRCVKRIFEKYNTEIVNIDNTQLDISSTEIRERLENGTAATGLVPVEVERYIKEHGLYRK